jgi:DNA-binding response OmpR family regulator
MLEALGMDCTSVARSDEGLAMCKATHPNVVVMEASETRKIQPFLRLAKTRAGGHPPPVLFFYSKSPDMSVIGETILNGAAEFLMLPFDRELLGFKLRQAGILPSKAA